LATWKLSDERLLSLLVASLDLGITTLDHADIYGDHTCEGLLGRALGLQPSLRQRLQLVGKCGIKPASPNRPENKVKHYDTSKAHILGSVEASLQALHTDYLDLLLLHRPDPLMQPDEVAEAFSQLRQEGKVRHFGVSNFASWQVHLLGSRLPFPLVTNQVELSLLALDVLHDGTLDQCLRLHMTPMVWSPLAGGRIFSSDEPPARRVRQALREIGEELNMASLDQVALAWLFTHPANVLPVLGSNNLDYLRSAAAANDLRLTRQQWFQLLEAAAGRPVP
jgi:predicted oxidoreductase